jgi:hypothetical protein
MINKAKYKLHFYFDYQCENCLWCYNDESFKRFGIGPIDGTIVNTQNNIIQEPKIILPISLKKEIKYLSQLFDSSLNWDDPKQPEPSWTIEKQEEFNSRSEDLLNQIRAFLGSEYEVIKKNK